MHLFPPIQDIFSPPCQYPLIKVTKQMYLHYLLFMSNHQMILAMCRMKFWRYDNLEQKYHGIAITALKCVILRCLGLKKKKKVSIEQYMLI